MPGGGVYTINMPLAYNWPGNGKVGSDMWMIGAVPGAGQIYAPTYHQGIKTAPRRFLCTTCAFNYKLYYIIINHLASTYTIHLLCDSQTDTQYVYSVLFITIPPLLLLLIAIKHIDKLKLFIFLYQEFHNKYQKYIIQYLPIFLC